MVGECGWPARLGTIMLEQALMLKARTQLLPASHHARRILSLAEGTTVRILWTTALASIERRLGLSRPLPSITSFFSARELDEARNSKESRLSLLHHFKAAVIRPACVLYDQAAFDVAGTRDSWPYAAVQSGLGALPDELLRVDWDSTAWKHYTLWATVRVTGSFPSSYFGWDSVPSALSFCPFCRCPDATIEHLLGSCPASVAFYTFYVSASRGLGCFSSADRPPWQHFHVILFTWTVHVPEMLTRSAYVGRCCELVAEAYER